MDAPPTNRDDGISHWWYFTLYKMLPPSSPHPQVWSSLAATERRLNCRGPRPRYSSAWRFVFSQGDKCHSLGGKPFIGSVFKNLWIVFMFTQLIRDAGQGPVDKYWRSAELMRSLSMSVCQGDLFQCELPDLPDARYSHTQDNLTGSCHLPTFLF